MKIPKRPRWLRIMVLQWRLREMKAVALQAEVSLDFALRTYPSERTQALNRAAAIEKLLMEEWRDQDDRYRNAEGASSPDYPC